MKERIDKLDLGESLASSPGPWDATAAMACIAKKIYGTYGELFESIASLGGVNAKLFERGNTRAVGFILDGHACVVFRGTAVAGDWWTDAKFLWTGTPHRHRGFMQAWRRIDRDVTEWLRTQQAAGRRVVLAGHSLGAVLAILAAFDLAPRADIAGVITFGAPRVGSLAFRRAYQNRRSGPVADAPTLGRVTWRFVEGGDVVTILPPPLMYFHVGRAAGPRPYNLLRPLERAIQDESSFDAWSRRLANATAELRTMPPAALNLRNGLKAISLLLALIGLFVPPVSPAFSAAHPRWTLAIGLFLTVPGLMIVRAVVLSSLDHPCQNYCDTFYVRPAGAAEVPAYVQRIISATARTDSRPRP